MAKAGYKVHGAAMRVEPQLNESGTGIEDMHVIPFTITTGPAQGARRSVKVPHSVYSPATAKAAIEADVDQAHDVASLGEQSPRS